MNVRVVQGIFDDLNAETAPRWVYPDTKRGTRIATRRNSSPRWPNGSATACSGSTINLQGGSPVFQVDEDAAPIRPAPERQRRRRRAGACRATRRQVRGCRQPAAGGPSTRCRPRPHRSATGELSDRSRRQSAAGLHGQAATNPRQGRRIGDGGDRRLLLLRAGPAVEGRSRGPARSAQCHQLDPRPWISECPGGSEQRVQHLVRPRDPETAARARVDRAGSETDSRRPPPPGARRALAERRPGDSAIIPTRQSPRRSSSSRISFSSTATARTTRR